MLFDVNNSIFLKWIIFYIVKQFQVPKKVKF